MAIQLIYFKEKRIGVYDTDRNTFTKYGVKKSKHLHKIMNAWGVDENTFNNILKPCCRIIIHECEENKVYETSKGTMERLGEYRNFGEHGLQIFLPLEDWKIT